MFWFQHSNRTIDHYFCLVSSAEEHSVFSSSPRSVQTHPLKSQRMVKDCVKYKQIEDLLMQEHGFPECLNMVLEQLHCCSSQRTGRWGKWKAADMQNETWMILEEGRISYTTLCRSSVQKSFRGRVTFNPTNSVNAPHLPV